MSDSESSCQHEENSVSITRSVAMGTGVMIGAGIFALTGQVAEQAGGLFPLAFLDAAFVAGFSGYSYVKMAEQNLVGWRHCHVPNEGIWQRDSYRWDGSLDVLLNGHQ